MAIAITITLIIDMTIRRDAAIGVAQAERDAGVREAECLMQCEQVFMMMMMMMTMMMVILLFVRCIFSQAKNSAQSKIEYQKKLLAVEQADCDR